MSNYLLCKGTTFLTADCARDVDLCVLSKTSSGKLAYLLTKQMNIDEGDAESSLDCFIDITVDSTEQGDAIFTFEEKDHLGIATLALIYQGYSVIQESIALDLMSGQGQLSSQVSVTKKSDTTNTYQPISL